MTDLEMIFTCILIFSALAFYYIAGKGDLLNLVPKMLNDRLEEINKKHGIWIVNKSPAEVEYKCSICGFSFIESDPEQKCDYNFCPMCGGDLRSDNNAE